MTNKLSFKPGDRLSQFVGYADGLLRLAIHCDGDDLPIATNLAELLWLAFPLFYYSLLIPLRRVRKKVRKTLVLQSRRKLLVVPM